VGRREEPPRDESGFRAHGSNQRFHRLLRHAVARARTTAPSLAGVSPAARRILTPHGWRRKGPPETYTASYLAALVVLARLSAALGQSSFDERQLSELPDRVRAAAQAPPLLESPPERLLVLAGVGPGAVTAREGALKLREAARLPAEGYEAEYLLHGSAVPLRRGDVFLAIQPTSDPFSLLERVAAAAAIEGLDVRTVHEPEGLHPVLMQIPLTVRLQTLASALADAQGIDPDRVIRASWAEDRLWRAGDV
jgi:glutamine---fructose-6-phosphate transaminase (isomerizing)